MPAPTISPLPTPPSRNAPSTFSDRMDAFLAAIPTFQTQANTLAAYLDALAAVGLGTSSDGTAGAPGMAFTADLDTGFYRPGANAIGVAIGGAARALFADALVSLATRLELISGTAALPSFYMNADANTGFYWPGADQLGFSTGGARRMLMSTTLITADVPLSIPVGAVGAVGLPFTGELNTGVYRPTAGTWAVATAGVERIRAKSTGLQVNGLLDGTAVTQSQVDSTPDRLLKVGDFGLGAEGNLAPGSAPGNANLALRSGFYHIAPTTLNNPTSNTCTLIVSRAANVVTQIAITGGGTRAEFIRHSTDSGATWSTWAMCYNEANLVGTCGFVGTRIVGAVIEQGSNANGEYTKWADGTMICTREYITPSQAINSALATYGGFQSPTNTWTFPAEFIDAPVCLGNTFNGFSVRCTGNTATSCNLHATSITSTGTSMVRYLYATAIGRWN